MLILLLEAGMAFYILAKFRAKTAKRQFFLPSKIEYHSGEQNSRRDP
jgi:hypothetical protein